MPVSQTGRWFHCARHWPSQRIGSAVGSPQPHRVVAGGGQPGPVRGDRHRADRPVMVERAAAGAIGGPQLRRVVAGGGQPAAPYSVCLPASPQDLPGGRPLPVAALTLVTECDPVLGPDFARVDLGRLAFASLVLVISRRSSAYGCRTVQSAAQLATGGAVR